MYVHWLRSVCAKETLGETGTNMATFYDRMRNPYRPTFGECVYGRAHAVMDACLVDGGSWWCFFVALTDCSEAFSFLYRSMGPLP